MRVETENGTIDCPNNIDERMRILQKEFVGQHVRLFREVVGDF